ncbi:MAG TPA: sugar transferase [Bacteroidota bacterium]|nr:sugar transferase [Bacteroidota bacterium]
MNNPRIRHILEFSDWIVFNLAFLYAVLLHLHTVSNFVSPVFPYISLELLIFMIYSALGIVIFHYNNLYNINVVFSIADQSVRLLESMFYVVFGFAVVSFFAKSSIIVNSRLVIILYLPVSLGFLIVERIILFRAGLIILARYEKFRRNLVLVGAGRVGKLLAANITLNNPFGMNILGYVDDGYAPGTPVFRGLKSIGRMNDILPITQSNSVDEILICVEGTESEKLLEILERCLETGAQVKIASPLYDVMSKFRFSERYGEIPVVGLTQAVNANAHELSKRIFDLVFAVFGMLVLWPAFLLIALAIKIDSAGPIFYRQTRIGKNGKPFTFYKFRSMFVGSDNDESRIRKVVQLIRGEIAMPEGGTKIVDESKITRSGRFIRRTSLDELPQLFNVIMGDMSLVGPRPCLPYEWENYEDWQKKRLGSMPGCTGVWQVSGRNAISFNDMVILDFCYIQNASLFLDLQLILKTIPVMIMGRGGK